MTNKDNVKSSLSDDTETPNNDQRKLAQEFNDLRKAAINISKEVGIKINMSLWDLYHDISFITSIFKAFRNY